MRKGLLVLIFSLISSLVPFQLIGASAWDGDSSSDGSGGTLYIAATYFASGKAVASGRPNGTHKQLAMGCNDGDFEIALFDFNSRGELLGLGNPKTMKVKFDNKSAISVAINTNKGSFTVGVNNSSDLLKKILKAKTVNVNFPTARGSYIATFDVRGTGNHSSSFANAGCRF